MFTISAGVLFWPRSCHEPLICAMLLPVVSGRGWKGPWTFQGSMLAGTCQDRLEQGFKVAVGGGSDRTLYCGRGTARGAGQCSCMVSEYFVRISTLRAGRFLPAGRHRAGAAIALSPLTSPPHREHCRGMRRVSGTSLGEKRPGTWWGGTEITFWGSLSNAISVTSETVRGKIPPDGTSS